MDPTFHQGEYLIIDELTYLLRSPERGEVVVFRYPKDPSKFFIKRVIGLPGEKVSIAGTAVTVTKVNGETKVLTEPYAQEFATKPMSQTLGPEEYFVLGDNRPVSLDSRIWGAVPANLIKGRALFRLLPPSKLSFLPGQSN